MLAGKGSTRKLLAPYVVTLDEPGRTLLGV